MKWERRGGVLEAAHVMGLRKRGAVSNPEAGGEKKKKIRPI